MPEIYALQLSHLVPEPVLDPYSPNLEKEEEMVEDRRWLLMIPINCH